MALTRKFLMALSIEPEKIDEIIEAHSDTVDALKKQRDSFEVRAKEADDISKELEETKTELNQLKEKAEKSGDGVYKQQYEDLKKEYEDYKSDQQKKEILSKKTSAYKAILKDIGVSEKRLDAILKISPLDSIELDNDGKIKNSDELKKKLKEEWSDFITKDQSQGASVSTPPANGGNPANGQSRAAMLEQKFHGDVYGSPTKTT